MGKTYVNIRVCTETAGLIRRLKGYMEASTGQNYSMDRALSELISSYLSSVTVPLEGAVVPKLSGSKNK
ncbi:MAG: hypothetical protein QXR87_03290 [Candidatus Hadarchaeales archaeon]